jgi:RND superfamily putative drug exporter
LGSLARLAIRRRWLVIVTWIVVIVVAQGIASALGGAAYKDTFSLPHTETATVAKLLKNAGLNNQNGVVGTVVLKDKGGAFTGAPAGLDSTLAGLCTSGNSVALTATPWQSIDCLKPAAATSGNPKLLNTQRGSDTALVNITWQNNHYTPSLFKNVYDRVK